MVSLRTGVQAMASWIREAEGAALGEGLVQIREVGIDPLEAAFATGVRRFDKSGEYKADGALSLTAWLRWKCKLSGGAAMERVEIARQLEKLPQTQAAFANGDLGFQHVAVLARTAEHVGAAAVRKEEGKLLQAAQTMDPGQFTTVAKNFEHRVDAAGALAEANHAYQRRYFHIAEPQDGMVRLDGVLDAEGGATLRTALQPFMKPVKDDARSYGQRSADALVELGRQGSGSKHNGAGPRPQLIIRATVDTLAGTRGRSAGSPARVSLNKSSITRPGRSRRRPGARSRRATGAASFPAAPGRRSGATDITSCGGRGAARRRFPTSPCSAARTTAWSMKKVGSWSERRMLVTGRRSLPSTEFPPTPGRPDCRARLPTQLT